jgi:hypothetical protein
MAKVPIGDLDPGALVTLECGCSAAVFRDDDYGKEDISMKTHKYPDYMLAWTWVKLKSPTCRQHKNHHYLPVEPDTEVLAGESPDR